MNIITRINRLGVRPDMSENLKDRIVLTNRITLILTIGNLQYIYAGIVLYPKLLSVLIFGVLSQLFTFLFNYLGYTTLSRAMICVIPTVITALFHLGLVPPGEPPYTSLLFLQFALVFMPWVLFELKEVTPLAITNLIGVGIFMSVLTLEGFNTFGYETSIYGEGFNYYSSMFISLVGTIFALYLIKQLNQKSMKKNDLLLQEMELKNEEMTEKQEKLNTYISQIEQTQTEEKKRNWMREQLAIVTDLVRSHKETAQKNDELIATVVKSLEANQGGLFILKEEGNQKVLSLEACYAYHKKKYIEKTLEIGQGLVGQCFLEKEHIHLTEIPQGYTFITSGLGEATPHTLLLVPLKHDDEVVGVIEIASFQAFETHHIEYMNSIGNILGNHIINQQMVEMTRKLLEETQNQAQQLQSSEEELRQNMEEMTATQEEMSREIRRYEEMLEEERRRNETTEQRLKALITSSDVKD